MIELLQNRMMTKAKDSEMTKQYGTLIKDLRAFAEWELSQTGRVEELLNTAADVIEQLQEELMFNSGESNMKHLITIQSDSWDNKGPHKVSFSSTAALLMYLEHHWDNNFNITAGGEVFTQIYNPEKTYYYLSDYSIDIIVNLSEISS